METKLLEKHNVGFGIVLSGGGAQNVKGSKKLHDFLIEPPQTRDYTIFNFNKAEENNEIGFQETEKQILHAFESIELEKNLELERTCIEFKFQTKISIFKNQTKLQT